MSDEEVITNRLGQIERVLVSRSVTTVIDKAAHDLFVLTPTDTADLDQMFEQAGTAQALQLTEEELLSPDFLEIALRRATGVLAQAKNVEQQTQVVAKPCERPFQLQTAEVWRLTERSGGNRSHHYEFAHNALRTTFFAHPHEALGALTAKQELPLIDLWVQVGLTLAHEGREVFKPRDLTVMLVTFHEDHACALVTLPRPAIEQEAYFVALVSTPTAFRFVTLERPLLITTEVDHGLLAEWTSAGAHVDTTIEMPVSLPGFIDALRTYIHP